MQRLCIVVEMPFWDSLSSHITSGDCGKYRPYLPDGYASIKAKSPRNDWRYKLIIVLFAKTDRATLHTGYILNIKWSSFLFTLRKQNHWSCCSTHCSHHNFYIRHYISNICCEQHGIRQSCKCFYGLLR